MRLLALIARIALLTWLAVLLVAQTQAAEQRFALVIGNSEYKAGQLPTGANDAGLIAETLRAAGFDVVGARDLDLDTLRLSTGEFLDKVSRTGPEAVTFVYFAGYGVQYEGENYFIPIDATLSRAEDIPSEAFRISDFMRALAATPGTKLFVIDAARQHPFAPAGIPLASGLGLVGPEPEMLIAFNATPGSIAIIENGPYGAFAQAMAEMIGTGGLGLDELFARLRLRVYETTNGVAVPWYISTLTRPFLFMERTPQAPRLAQPMSMADLQRRKMDAFGGDQDAFAAALALDSIGAYEEFLAVYPDSPLAPRVRAIIAVRREATIWRDTLNVGTREAYWSYLRSYPIGAHVADAQRRLAALAAAVEPPSTFVPMAHGVGVPPPEEVTFVSQPVLVFTGPGFESQPIPAFLLQPLAPAFSVLAPPTPLAAFFLPVPVLPFSSLARPPAFVRLPIPGPIQLLTINNITINNQTLGGAALLSAVLLPIAVVTRVNAGILLPPPPAAPPPAPISLSPATAVAESLPGQLLRLPPPNGLRTVSPAPPLSPPPLGVPNLGGLATPTNPLPAGGPPATTPTPTPLITVPSTPLSTVNQPRTTATTSPPSQQLAPLRIPPLPQLIPPLPAPFPQTTPSQTLTSFAATPPLQFTPPPPQTAPSPQKLTSPGAPSPPQVTPPPPIPTAPSQQQLASPAAPPPPQVTPPPPIQTAPSPQKLASPAAPPPPQVTPPPPIQTAPSPQKLTIPAAPPPPQVTPPPPIQTAPSPQKLNSPAAPPPPQVTPPPPVVNRPSPPPPPVNQPGPSQSALPAVKGAASGGSGTNAVTR